MTKDDIARMAREAGFERVVAIHPDGSKTVTVAPVPELEAFTHLVAAAEREECAKLVVGLFDPEDAVAEFIAEAIRARGTT